eukprot:g1653.t1
MTRCLCAGVGVVVRVLIGILAGRECACVWLCTPDKLTTAWSVPGNGAIKSVVSVPYYLDTDCSFSKQLGVEIEADPEKNTAFAGSPAKSVDYPHGMTQPACIAVTSTGEVLFEWKHPIDFNPKGGKLGNGAKSRVLPEDVVSIVADKLEGKAPSISEARVDLQDSVSKQIQGMMKAMRAARKKAAASKSKL